MDHNSIKKFLNQGTTTERTRITNSNALRTNTLLGLRVRRQGEFHKGQGCQPSYSAADSQANVGRNQLRILKFSQRVIVDLYGSASSNLWVFRTQSNFCWGPLII